MKTINGLQWRDALLSAANAISNNVERINSLNVFPVPDGDTGSNMSATFEYATNEVRNVNDKSIAAIGSKFARGMLLGARGNSGVILSQIFKGFSTSFEGKQWINSADIVDAFVRGTEFAYKSVMKPVEGTILTVIRQTAEGLQKNIKKELAAEAVFGEAIKLAKISCDNTPELLPVLKEVGVTDSGGEGLIIILEGIYQGLIGKPVEIQKQQQKTDNFFVMQDEVYDGEFGYCTEFVVKLRLPKMFDRSKFEKALARMGNSIVVVHDDDILKVHVHTLYPGETLTFAQKFGEFIRIKSENMTLQANNTSGKEQKVKSEAKVSLVEEKNKNATKAKVSIGVISCNVGQGIINEMYDLGTNFIIEAGQTMNPSAQDLLTAIDALNAEDIFILPNNSNIILAAQQVAQTSKKNIVVIPTKTQVQGISVMQNFDPSASFEENKNNMNDAIENVLTGQVTQASRTTKIDGVQIRKDEFLSIAEKDIISSEKSKVAAAVAVVDELMTSEIELVSIYYGDSATEADATDLASYIETNYNDVDIEIKDGGQPLYPFFLGFYKELNWE